MPRGPKGERRPADVIGAAVMVAKIATGEIEDAVPYDGKNKVAQASGRIGGAKGGEARSKALTAETRSAIAKKAAAKRWAKSD